ncbi:MAG: hypothetical protein AAFV85_02270 [Cyanobacteria bacterium J06634_6]
MKALEPLEQLAVDAFVTALETCQEEGVELPNEVWAIAQSPEEHAANLSEIAKQHPQLHNTYRIARKVLRKSESVRSKRMNTQDSVLLKRPGLSFVQPINTPLSSSEKAVTTEMPSNGSSKTFDSSQRPDTSVHNGQSETSSPDPIQPVIYRYTLPDTASPQAAIAFTKQVEAIRKSNPDWVVSSDRPKAGEADAIILIHKDEHYTTTHATYLMNQTLNGVVAPALNRVFGATPSQVSTSSN